jgi:hypothetical protein
VEALHHSYLLSVEGALRLLLSVPPARCLLAAATIPSSGYCSSTNARISSPRNRYKEYRARTQKLYVGTGTGTVRQSDNYFCCNKEIADFMNHKLNGQSKNLFLGTVPYR